MSAPVKIVQHAEGVEDDPVMWQVFLGRIRRANAVTAPIALYETVHPPAKRRRVKSVVGY